MSQNPFANRAMIKEPAGFYGRQAELKELYTRLSAMQSHSIVGPRRIGKSSLLYQLAQPVHYEPALPEAERYLFAFIDLQELAGLGPDDFFYTVADRFQQAAQRVAAVALDIDPEQDGTMRGFRRLLMRLSRQEIRLVLCCDEFEMLSDNVHFGVDFFTYLRGLCSNYDLAMVTASRESLHVLCHQGGLRTSQFWNIFGQLDLGLLAPAEAETMMIQAFQGAGQRISAEEMLFAQRWAGRHPMFIQIFCYHLFRAKQEETGGPGMAQIEQQYLAEAEPHLAYAWNRLEAREQGQWLALARAVAQDRAYPLSESDFSRLARQALVSGTPEQPMLVNRGWQRFLERQEPADVPPPPEAPAATGPDELPTTPAAPPASQVNLGQLRRMMNEYFDLNEIQDLCFDLQINYDQLPGGELGSKVRELIEYSQRRGSLEELVTLCQQARPHVKWPGMEDEPAAGEAASGETLAAAGSSETEYRDFSLKIEQIDSSTCRVLVLDSPAGQDQMTCRLPFDLASLGPFAPQLAGAITRGGASTDQGQLSAEELGSQLFDTIFSGAIGQLFFESWGQVSHREQGLRIKLHFDPERSPQISALPWEFLYNRRRRLFYSLNRRTPLLRYLDVQAPTRRPRVKLPLRILVAIAAPLEWPPLDVAAEQQAIAQAWGSHPELAVEFLAPATVQALQQKCQAYRPHVIHFMGHGLVSQGQGAIVLVDESGRPTPLYSQQLATLLSNTPSVQLAFLNACESAAPAAPGADPFSSLAYSLVLSGLPAVVAMQFPISDAAAIAFANGFYPRLASGEAVDLAVANGREMLHLTQAGSQEWGTPVLFTRSSDGRLFDWTG